MTTTIVTISVRVTAHWLAQIDAETERLRTLAPGARYGRSDTIRMLLLRALIPKKTRLRHVSKPRAQMHGERCAALRVSEYGARLSHVAIPGRRTVDVLLDGVPITDSDYAQIADVLGWRCGRTALRAAIATVSSPAVPPPAP